VKIKTLINEIQKEFKGIEELTQWLKANGFKGQRKKYSWSVKYPDFWLKESGVDSVKITCSVKQLMNGNSHALFGAWGMDNIKPEAIQYPDTANPLKLQKALSAVMNQIKKSIGQ